MNTWLQTSNKSKLTPIPRCFLPVRTRSVALGPYFFRARPQLAFTSTSCRASFGMRNCLLGETHTSWSRSNSDKSFTFCPKHRRTYHNKWRVARFRKHVVRLTSSPSRVKTCFWGLRRCRRAVLLSRSCVIVSPHTNCARSTLSPFENTRSRFWYKNVQKYVLNCDDFNLFRLVSLNLGKLNFRI